VSAVAGVAWPQPAPDTVVRDVYSEREDGVVAEVDGEPLLWSDLARVFVERWGSTTASGHMDQLIYTAVLRQELEQHGLVVTQADIEAELHRSMRNSMRAGSGMRGTGGDLDEYLRRVQVNTGKNRAAFERFNWGYAAQSKLVDERWPQAWRVQQFEAGLEPRFAARYQVAHILSQTLADKRTPEEARARLQRAKERLDAGEDWNQVCWEVSDDFRSVHVNTSRPETVDRYIVGKLDEFTPGSCPFGPAIGEAAQQLTEPGQVSGIIQTEYGYHLLRLISVKPKPSYDAVVDEYHGLLCGRYLREKKATARVTRHIFGESNWSLPLHEHRDLVVAEVNGEELLLSDFGRLMYLNQGPRDGRRYIQMMLEDYALWRQGRQLGVEVTAAEVEATLLAEHQSAITGGSARSDQDLQTWLVERGRTSRCSPAQYRALRHAVLFREATLTALVTPEEIARYYQENRGQFAATYHTRVVHIYHYTGDHTPEEARALATRVRQKLDGMRASLAATSPDRVGHPDAEYFKLLVDEYGELSTVKRSGGTMPPWRPGVSGLGPAFERAVLQLSPGDAGGPISINGGYAVFELMQIDPELDLEAASPQIDDLLRRTLPRALLQQAPHHIEPDLLGIPDQRPR
jgi:parvulin-like peptidyl-prolyl isomerase